MGDEPQVWRWVVTYVRVAKAERILVQGQEATEARAKHAAEKARGYLELEAKESYHVLDVAIRPLEKETGKKMGKVMKREVRVSYVCDVDGCPELAVARMRLRVLPLDKAHEVPNLPETRILYVCDAHAHDLASTFTAEPAPAPAPQGELAEAYT